MAESVIGAHRRYHKAPLCSLPFGAQATGGRFSGAEGNPELASGHGPLGCGWVAAERQATFGPAVLRGGTGRRGCAGRRQRRRSAWHRAASEDLVRE